MHDTCSPTGNKVAGINTDYKPTHTQNMRTATLLQLLGGGACKKKKKIEKTWTDRLGGLNQYRQYHECRISVGVQLLDCKPLLSRTPDPSFSIHRSCFPVPDSHPLHHPHRSSLPYSNSSRIYRCLVAFPLPHVFSSPPELSCSPCILTIDLLGDDCSPGKRQVSARALLLNCPDPNGQFRHFAIYIR